MIHSPARGPINLGNPEELTVSSLAELVLKLTGSSSPIEYRSLPVDDPTRRRPVIDRAAEALDWKPEIPVAEGIRRTVSWLRGNS